MLFRKSFLTCILATAAILTSEILGAETTIDFNNPYSISGTIQDISQNPALLRVRGGHGRHRSGDHAHGNHGGRHSGRGGYPYRYHGYLGPYPYFYGPDDYSQPRVYIQEPPPTPPKTCGQNEYDNYTACHYGCNNPNLPFPDRCREKCYEDYISNLHSICGYQF